MINEFNSIRNYPEKNIKEIHDIIDQAVLESQNKFNSLSEALQVLWQLSQIVKNPSEKAMLARAITLIEQARL